ncbi:hypothetical protein F5Y16DRAFT_376142 [Xylariaceae sp. FL0255]|nr:hypothetical protein F5Y16DRAFT_376142 [Xylariaceae sp. FL0255]
MMRPAKDDIGIHAPPPPPYETEAYMHHQRWPPVIQYRRLRGPCSPIRVALALTLATILIIVSWIKLSIQVHSEPAFLSTIEEGAEELKAGLQRCRARDRFPPIVDPATRETNPRWNAVRGQKGTIALRNATLFDGEQFVNGTVDIVLRRGLIVSVEPATSGSLPSLLRDEDGDIDEGLEYDLDGRYVTPGLVDMHSHHMLVAWPLYEGFDGNEVNELFGPITSFLKITETIKAFDIGTKQIAAGGVTSSLVIPGSANIMGGEGTVVKNLLKSGESGEYVVEDMLLEHGIPVLDRHRYMKMACGENPQTLYKHTRMALAYILRKHLARAQDVMKKQDRWCSAASEAASMSQAEQHRLSRLIGAYPDDVELESTIGLIRGRVTMQNHCYESEDFETMMGVVHEAGFHVKAFHHAIEAWQVPEMLLSNEPNITVAIFAETGFYKDEAYSPNLYAGAILNAHGLPVAYHSDHGSEELNSRYLILQASVGHGFHLSAEKALQAVTSVPAKALDLSYRIGYIRRGYDADVVVWDDHPLAIGATPQQVFIDGVATLDVEVVQESAGSYLRTRGSGQSSGDVPQMRARKTESEAQKACSQGGNAADDFVITGIRKSFLNNYTGFTASISESGNDNLTLVISKGIVTCLAAAKSCEPSITITGPGAVHIHLDNGHLLPGLIAVTHGLGIVEIDLDEFTENGIASVKNIQDPAYIDYAKHGISLDGKAFARARLGGVTRAITPPQFPLQFLLASAGDEAILQGVSVGIKTNGKQTILDGGIFHEDIGLHMVFGNTNKAAGSISQAVGKLRSILEANTGKGNASTYGLVADGMMPLIVEAPSVALAQQMVAIKRDYPDVNLILKGGHAAPRIANELARHQIPVILSATRPAPTDWELRNVISGPPLTRSPADILTEAGVQYAVSVAGAVPQGDSRIHALALEASWAAKYAGLSEHEAVRLVSTNVEDILGLRPSKDIVVWENSPLQVGGTVILSLEENANGKLFVGTCWPDERVE